MKYQPEDDLTVEERRAFANLPRERVPPNVLEDRVVQSLNQAGLIKRDENFWKRHWRYAAAGIAAAILFFVMGAVFTKWLTRTTANATPAQFMLVLYQNPTQPELSRDAELKHAKEYGNWARELRKQGLPVDGEKLKSDTPFVKIVEGHPSAPENPTNKIAGFFLISAADYQQAVKIAETCPHAKHGGIIEVREIDHF